MPLYDYECQSCGHSFNKIQPITSSAPAITFKGSGFYCTDNKKPKRLKRRFGKDHQRGTSVTVGDMSKVKGSGK
jgi:predicted nucleic acid-binding Zn ribbon protein